MKPVRIRYLLVFFAAMFLANNAVASVRACMVQFTAQEHTAIRVLDSSSDTNLCPEADSETNCLVHCTKSFKGDEQKVSFDVPPATALAPPPTLHRVWFPVAPRRLVYASAPPVAGPPLTILFRNLRN